MTLRDFREHKYLGTRCSACGAEFDVVNGALICVSPGTQTPGAQAGSTDQPPADQPSDQRSEAIWL